MKTLPNIETLPKPSPGRRAGHRIAVLVTATIARLLLVAAGFTLLALLLLVVLWWRILSWPHRHANRAERSQALATALQQLLHTLGVLLALRRTANAATCSNSNRD